MDKKQFFLSFCVGFRVAKILIEIYTKYWILLNKIIFASILSLEILPMAKKSRHFFFFAY